MLEIDGGEESGGARMLRRYTPFNEMFGSMWKEFEDLRNTLDEFRKFPAEVSRPRRMLPLGLMKTEVVPAVECFTRDKQFILRVELPGVDPKDVEVSITGNQLMIKGEKKEEKKIEETDLLFQEIAHGTFERTFALPEGLKLDQIKATFTNGVLELTMPAEKLETLRKVPIEYVEPGKKVIKAA